MTADTDGDADGIEIPWRELSDDALAGLAEAFVLREGTDYGEREASFACKVTQVIDQVRAGEAAVVFDPRTSSAGIVTRRTLDCGHRPVQPDS